MSRKVCAICLVNGVTTTVLWPPKGKYSDEIPCCDSCKAIRTDPRQHSKHIYECEPALAWSAGAEVES